MQALTIVGALLGGISATSEILKGLDMAISTTSKIRDAPEQAVSTLRDVRMMRANMVRFQQLLDNQNNLRERGIYIPLDDTQNTFTDCVTSLDELESLLKPLSDPKLKPLDLVDRLEWVMKDKRIETLCKRVHDAQSSLGLMLTILSNESLIEVQNALAGLSGLTQRIGDNVAHLSRRSIISTSDSTISGSNFDGEDTNTIRPSSALRRASQSALLSRPDSVVLPDGIPSPTVRSMDQEEAVGFVARFAFEAALESSLAYRRAPEWNLDDVSFRSSITNPHAWSLFSKISSLSLGDMSTISVIALPIFSSDLRNSKHYHFGNMRENASGTEEPSNPHPSLAIPGPPPSRPLPPQPELRLTRVATNPAMPISPPQTPNGTTRTGVTRVLKTLKKALDTGKRTNGQGRNIPDPEEEPPWIQNMLDPGIVEITDPSYNSSARLPYSPSISPTLNLPTEDTRSLHSRNSIQSLGQLSNLSLEENDAYLFHSNSGLPCQSLIDPFRDDEDIETKMCNGQLSLAASHGILDSFRCGTCKMSLASISKREIMGKPRFEIWCGAPGCLACRELSMCPCYTKIRELSLLTDKFFGCRLLPGKEVKCSRCFTYCPDCIPENMEDYIEGFEIFSTQNDFFKVQSWLFESASKHTEIEWDEKTFNYHLAQLEVRLQIFVASNKNMRHLKSLLETRLRILNWKKGILPTWREMNNLIEQGSDFYQVPLQNMKDQIDDSDEYIARDLDQKMNLIPGLNEFRLQHSSTADEQELFEKLLNINYLPGLAI